MSARARAFGVLAAAAVCVATLAGAGEAGAQERAEELARRCGGEDAPGLLLQCREVALAAQAVQGGVGLAAALGASVPGSASTLGRRIGGTPRLSFDLRAGVVRFDMPDVLDEVGAPAPSTSVLAPVLHAGVDVGVFQGFSVAPTLGGILSLDVRAEGAWVLLAEGDGFDGSVGGLGLGVRVGVLRESFTTPGITVSLTRHWMGEVAYGGEDDSARAGLDPDATSLRVTMGKDLVAVGLLAGVGWDRYGGRAIIRATDPTSSAPGVQGAASDGSFVNDRVLFYGGVSYTLLVLQLSAEGGWARGWDPPPARPVGGFDPGSGSLFGSVSVRLTY